MTHRPSNDDHELLAWLASLPPLEYDRRRKEEADNLGVRAETLDSEIARLRAGEAAGNGTGNAVDLSDPEPWPHEVNGAGLLDFLVRTIRRHAILPTGAPEAVALWVLHAHAHDAATISPILVITSPTPECGKTTVRIPYGLFRMPG